MSMMSGMMHGILRLFMKRGDLVRCAENVYCESENRSGVILTWVRTGGPEDTVWEVLYPDGIEYWDESDLEVINECR